MIHIAIYPEEFFALKFNLFMFLLENNKINCLHVRDLQRHFDCQLTD